MDHFQYDNGQLRCERADIASLAERFGTPLYVYSSATFRDHVDRVSSAFAPLRAAIRFSVKSCSNLAILRLLRELGSGFDVVSGGELLRALEAGADPPTLVFAGVGKTEAEMRLALEHGIGWFNVESESELALLAGLAERMDVTARVAVRVNPDVDARTHAYTTTGTHDTKFGIDVNQAGRLFGEFAGRRGVNMSGLHVHLGSPINSVTPYVEGIRRTLDLIDRLRSAGHDIRALNLGGGFGAHYDGEQAPPATTYANALIPLLRDRGLDILIEPGRSIAANAGILVTRVLHTKSTGRKRFVIVDASMTDLIRPSLYGSFHFAWPVTPGAQLEPPSRSANVEMNGLTTVDIVGPVCESGDFLAKDRRIPPVSGGELLAVFTTGAYGFSMSSQYNSRPRAAEVLVEGDQARLIRRRETYDDLVAAEREAIDGASGVQNPGEAHYSNRKWRA